MKHRVRTLAAFGLMLLVSCVHSKSCTSCGDEPAPAPEPKTQSPKAYYNPGNHTEAPIEIGTPLASSLDHVTFLTNDPKSVYFFFVNQLGLPEALPLQNHPTHMSGAVTVGNLLIEFFRPNTGPAVTGVNASFASLNFEPQDLVRTPGELDRRHIAHGPPELFNAPGIGTSVNAISTTLTVKDMASDQTHVRFYQSHVSVMADRRELFQRELAKVNGGTLGVVSAREVDVFVPDLEAAKARWKAVFGEPRSGDSAWQLANGPLIQLTTDLPSNGKIILEVADLAAARQVLTNLHALSHASTDDDLEVEPTLVQSVEIHVVAKSKS